MCNNSSSCCLQFARIVLIIFNALFMLCGLLLIAVGIWLLVDPAVLKILQLTGDAYNSGLLRVSAILLLSTGCAVFLITILGFIGAIVESKVMLGIYIALLVIVFCAEVTGAVLAIAFKDWLLDGLEDTLLKSLTKINPTYYQNKSGTCAATSNGALWDYVQVQMNCCGIYDYPHTGYEQLTYYIGDNCPNMGIYYNSPLSPSSRNYPLTCCQQSDNASSVFNSDNQPSQQYLFNCTSIKTQGCSGKLETWVGRYSPVLIGIGFGVAFLKVLGFIFAVCVCVNAPRHCFGYKRQH